MVKTVIYVRGSTDRQEHTLEVQEKRCLEVCEGEYIIFRDQGGSANQRLSQRPILQKALEELREGDILLMTCVDRAVRNIVDWGGLVYELEKRKANIKFIDNKIGDNATDRFAFHVRLCAAEFEVQIMHERQKKVFQLKKEKGEKLGGYAVFGFEAVGDNKKLEPCKEEVKTIKRLFELRAQRKTILEICEQAKREGLKNRSGRFFQPSHLAKILRKEDLYKPLLQQTFYSITPENSSTEFEDHHQQYLEAVQG